MSVQRRSQFALACAGSGCARLEKPPKPGEGGAFTVCATFRPRHTDDSGLLIRQENGLALGFSDGCIYAEIPGMSRVSSVPLDCHLMENEWNTAAATYSGGTLQLYLNGLPAADNTGGKRDACNWAGADTPWDMGMFRGYLQRVEFYGRGLTEEEMWKAAFIPLPDAALAVDFDSYLPQTSGAQSGAVRLLEGCDTVNLVRALHPGRTGCVLSIAGIPAVSGSFTLLVKCYLRREEHEEQEFLLSAGGQGSSDFMGMALCGDRKTLTFFLAGGQLSAPVQISPDRWTDMAVSVEKDGKAVLYVDGAPVGTGTLPGVELPAGFMLGNAQSAGGTLQNGLAGVIDSAALFSAALDGENLCSCAENGLTGFENSLEALWIFSEEDGTEQKRGGFLAYSGGAAVVECRNTVQDREPPELVYDLPETAKKPDEMSRWEAGMVANAFDAAIQAAGFAGTVSLPLNDSQVQAMAPVMQAIPSQTIYGLEKKRSFDGEDLRDIFHYGMAGGIGGMAAYAMYAASRNGGWRRVNLFRRFCLYFRLSLTVPGFSKSAWAGAAAVAATAYFIKHVRPEPGGERPVKKCSAALESLAFYNDRSAAAGALCMRPEPGKEPILPEWNSDGQNAAVCYYAAGGETAPVLRAVFQVTVPADYSAELTFSAQAVSDQDLLGNAEKTVTVSHTGPVTIDFSLSDHRLKSAAAGLHQVQWDWFCREDDRQCALGTTKHRVHLLYGRPLSPWETEKNSANLPLAPLVELCSSIAGRNCTGSDAQSRFLSQTVDWAHRQSGLQALDWETAPRYTWWDARYIKLSIDLAKLCKALPETERLPVTWQDAACLQMMLARLEGFDQVRLCFLASVSCGLLALRNGTGAGGETLPHAWLSRYALCSLKKDAVPRLYDAFFRPEGMDVPVSGMELCEADQLTECASSGQTYWRDRACLPETYCTPELYTQSLFIGQMPLKTIIVYNGMLESRPERPPFSEKIKSALALPPGPVRCHSISFDYIEGVVMQVLNKMGSELDDEEGIAALEILCNAVTVQCLDDYPNLQTLCSETLDCLSTAKDRAKFGNSLVRALNNVIANLRVGRSDWNSSISNQFDPTSWLHIELGQDGNAYVDSTDGSLDECELLNTEKHFPEGYLPKPVGPGFYLTSPNDSIRLSELLQLKAKPYCILMPSIIGGCALDIVSVSSDATDRRKRLLYSSSNQWNLTDRIQRHAWTAGVYYVKDGSWVRYGL